VLNGISGVGLIAEYAPATWLLLGASCLSGSLVCVRHESILFLRPRRVNDQARSIERGQEERPAQQRGQHAPRNALTLSNASGLWLARTHRLAAVNRSAGPLLPLHYLPITETSFQQPAFALDSSSYSSSSFFAISSSLFYAVEKIARVAPEPFRESTMTEQLARCSSSDAIVLPSCCPSSDHPLLSPHLPRDLLPFSPSPVSPHRAWASVVLETPCALIRLTFIVVFLASRRASNDRSVALEREVSAPTRPAPPGRSFTGKRVKMENRGVPPVRVTMG